MQTFDVGQLGIDQGEAVLFSDFEDGGEMWTGDGPRQVRLPVAFSEAFSAVPIVNVSITMFDASSGSNTRFDIQAEGVTPQGFDVVFRTWGDSKVARVRAKWQAIGSISAEEVWDI